MNQEKIGNIIKKIRKDNNLSQQDFANKYGVTYQAVSKWENGKNIPDLALLKQICKDYNLNIDSLLDGNIKKRKNIFIFIIMPIVTALIIGLLFFINKKDDFITLNRITSQCGDFIIDGNVAYNSSKGYISISEVKYCGTELNKEYIKIECILYEDNKGDVKELDRITSNGKAELTTFLKDIKFNVANYVKSCKSYDDDNLYIEIMLYSEENTYLSHKIPLKLNQVCDK